LGQLLRSLTIELSILEVALYGEELTNFNYLLKGLEELPILLKKVKLPPSNLGYLLFF